MRIFWRSLLLCLMALALPLQGLAAARTLHCADAAGRGHAAGMSAHAGDTARAHPAHGDTDGAHHARSPAHAHGHDHGHHHGQTDLIDPVDAQADAGSHPAQAPVDGHSCSACAACCVGLALPPAAPLMALPGHEPAHALVPDREAASFISSGPERPPRTDLA